MATGFDTQYAEAGFVAVERDAFDEAGNLFRLVCGPWLWLLSGRYAIVAQDHEACIRLRRLTGDEERRAKRKLTPACLSRQVCVSRPLG
jgi:hypothetical protein